MRKERLYRKFLAVVLTAAFFVTAAPQTVFADEAAAPEEAESLETAGEIPEAAETAAEGEAFEEETADEAALEGSEEQIPGKEAENASTDRNAPEELSFNTEYTGQFEPDKYDQHWYKFTLEKPATFTLNVWDDSEQRDLTYVVYNILNDPEDYNAYKKGNMAWQWKTHHQSEYGYANYMLKCIDTWLQTADGSDSVKLSLLAGTYYIPVYADFGTSYEKPLNYRISIKDVVYLEKKNNDETLLIDSRIKGSNDWKFFDDTGYDEYYENEPMPAIELNKPYRGILTEDSFEDYYYFTLPKDSPLYLTLESDEWIGDVQASFLYKKHFGETSYITDFYFNKDMCASQGAPLSGTELVATDTDVYKNGKFKAGEYAVYIRGNEKADTSKKIYRGNTGQYKFMISTGKNSGGKSTDKPVSSLKLDKKVISLGEGETSELTATVGPQNASDTTVSFAVEPEGIVEIAQKEPNPGENVNPGVTKFEIKALKRGNATVTIKSNGTNSKNRNLEENCEVAVIQDKSCEPIAVKQKIDLSSSLYFDTTFDKNDGFDVVPEDPKNKSIGSVSKGIFTAKKPGKVSIVWKRKEDKVFVPRQKITIELKQPGYKKNSKKKDIKTSDLIIKRNTVVRPEDWLLDLDNEETIKPTSFECDASSLKKGLATIDESGNVTVLMPGNIKVKALYGEGKNAAKMEFTIKSKIPFIKDAKVKPNTAKPNAKDKNVNLAVTNLPSSITLTADSWKIRKAAFDDEGKAAGYTDEEPDPEKIKLTPGVKGNYSKAVVSVAPGTEAQTVAVIATIDEVEYTGYLTIQ